jgi:hypothetical protein
MRKGGDLLKSSNRSRKIQSGPLVMRRVSIVSVVLSLVLLMPFSSPAASITGDSNTYLQSRETADDQKILGAYEYLDFSIQNLGNESISFHTGGWLRYDLKGDESDKKTADDLQYSYLSFKSKTDNAIVNLGRVMVFEGVASERVDGLYARTDLKGNFGISAFGGVPVETEINEPGNNVIYGAHLTHQMPGLYRIGLSYLKEEKNSSDFRKEEGLDLWFHPFNKVDIVGRSNYNAITNGWMENTYNLVLGPFANLRFTTEASWINYKDYFTGATSSAFMFPPGGILDPNEKVQRLGEDVAYALTDKVSIVVNYTKYDYEVSGSAKSYGGNIRYAVAAQGGAGLSLQRMDGESDNLKYMEYRVYGYKKISKIDLAVDLLDVDYDNPINGVSNAYSASIAGQYDLTERWKLGADVEYQKNPDFDKDVRVFLKAIYHFDIGSGTRKGA